MVEKEEKNSVVIVLRRPMVKSPRREIQLDIRVYVCIHTKKRRKKEEKKRGLYEYIYTLIYEEGKDVLLFCFARRRPPRKSHF